MNSLHHSLTIGESDRPKQNLFVVDDDPFVRTSLSRRLQRDGFLVHEFESGESVVGCLDNVSRLPDVIILDYKMTGINGLETSRLIRQRFPRIPVILLTAYLGVIDIDEAKREGVFEVLTKNIELENLRVVIQDALNRNQM
jgi:two-component system, NtrC family, response regulator HydG